MQFQLVTVQECNRIECSGVTETDVIIGHCRLDTCSAKASISLTWCQRALTTAILPSPILLVFCCSVRWLLATCGSFKLTYFLEICPLSLTHRFILLFPTRVTTVVLGLCWLGDGCCIILFSSNCEKKRNYKVQVMILVVRMD